MKGQYVTSKPKSKPSTKLTWRQKLDEATRYSRTVDICVRGDLYQQIADLDAELVEMAVANDGRLVGGIERLRKAEQIAALQEEMREYTEPFVYEALEPDDYKALERQHPPREGDQQDIFAGHNRDDFYEALIKTCLVSPEMTEDDWAKLLPKISQGQYDLLAGAAWTVNKGEVSVPFSQAASIILTSGSPSKRPNASASPSADSTAGSPSDARLTGTTSGDDADPR